MKQSWVLQALILKEDKEVERTGNQTTEMVNPKSLSWKMKNKKMIIVGENKGEQESM